MEGSRTVQIKFFAILREQAGVSSLSWRTACTSADTLYAELQQRFPNLKLPIVMLRVSLNERYVDKGAEIRDGDRIVFIPPVAGG